ncbi:hypothetical protein VP01_4858g1, partial [Puccinia sorghi]
ILFTLRVRPINKKAHTISEELENINQNTHEKENIKILKFKINEKITGRNESLSHKDHKSNSIIKPEVGGIKRIKKLGPKLVKTHNKHPGTNSQNGGMD